MPAIDNVLWLLDQRVILLDNWLTRVTITGLKLGLGPLHVVTPLFNHLTTCYTWTNSFKEQLSQ